MKVLERRRAEALRAKGNSIKDIARLLHVSQSTASRWCKNIPLSAALRETLDKRREIAGRTALTSINYLRQQAKRDDIRTQIYKGKHDVGNVTNRDVLMLGLGLYWGEGYKRGTQEWGFTNCDPEVILSIIGWLKICYDVHPDQLRARLTINNQYRTQSERLHREWARLTGIPRGSFSMPSFIIGYGKPGGDPRTYRGTLRIKVRRSTSLRRRILASIAEAGRQMMLNSRKTRS